MAIERVQKILAQAGITSRRKAEEMIIEGLVTINGKIAQLGDKADLYKDSIKVRGKLLRNTEPPIYLAFYKPKGVISMMMDPQGRPTLADYFTKVRSRIFPVGRLDFNSEGLILLTNDGKFAEELQKRDDIPKVYHVKIRGYVTSEMVSRLQRGMRLEGKKIKPHSVRLAEELSSKTKIEIVFLNSGAIDLKSYFEMKGFLTEKMTRTSIGHITLRGIKPGHYRLLQKSQVDALLTQPELGLKRLEFENSKKPEVLPRELLPTATTTPVGDTRIRVKPLATPSESKEGKRLKIELPRRRDPKKVSQAEEPRPLRKRPSARNQRTRS